MLTKKHVDRLRHGDVSVAVHSGIKVGADPYLRVVTDAAALSALSR